ncbi:C-type lectin domain family 10 member A-like protein [Labeo rohita]|uniref:C-type lectin domain family 10 member A-like protein n=1 Tax=Labeo rohita TaxID=84645 RepID=A0A498LDB2_LABRO|nr:C-type lectin domain family 10 member A-like protein [Labeo rohita]
MINSGKSELTAIFFSSEPSRSNLLTPGCTEPDWISFRNSCYLFSDNSMNWTEAKDYCEEKGAMLLKIEDGSEKEWQFVTNFAKPHDYWIGLTDESTGQWRWTDDTPYTINKDTRFDHRKSKQAASQGQPGGEELVSLTNVDSEDGLSIGHIVLICIGVVVTVLVLSAAGVFSNYRKYRKAHQLYQTQNQEMSNGKTLYYCIQ